MQTEKALLLYLNLAGKKLLSAMAFPKVMKLNLCRSTTPKKEKKKCIGRGIKVCVARRIVLAKHIKI